MEREALKLALEAMQINLTLLEKVNPHEDQEDLVSDSIDLTHKAIAKIKTALAQPAQEPVAHVYSLDHDGRPLIAWDNAKGIKVGDKIYTAPLQRKWVGLTDDEIDHQAKKDDHGAYFALGALWAGAKLKERNHGT